MINRLDRRVSRLALAAALLLVGSHVAFASEYGAASITPSSTTLGWGEANMRDGNFATAWSSSGHGSPNNAESFYFWTSGSHTVNYIRLVPRRATVGGVEVSLCVPESV